LPKSKRLKVFPTKGGINKSMLSAFCPDDPLTNPKAVIPMSVRIPRRVT